MTKLLIFFLLIFSFLSLSSKAEDINLVCECERKFRALKIEDFYPNAEEAPCRENVFLIVNVDKHYVLVDGFFPVNDLVFENYEDNDFKYSIKISEKEILASIDVKQSEEYHMVVLNRINGDLTLKKQKAFDTPYGVEQVDYKCKKKDKLF